MVSRSVPPVPTTVTAKSSQTTPGTAVAITTPPSVRHEIARECILAGLHVLLEKPPAATLSEIDAADVGQILFGQTVTASGDNMVQYRNADHGSPKKSVIMDIECDAGCGVVPFKYKDQNFVNALQWAIGLEIFLMVDDPWRIFLTTDHPNGAPFTTYPHLIKLLMDRSFRNAMLDTINPDARAMSNLAGLDREYSLYEIAIMTRAAPAKLIGLADRGHLAPGAAADIVVYKEDADRERMFEKPELVFKDGELVVRDGRIVKVVRGNTHAVKPEFDRSIEKKIEPYFQRYHSVRMNNFKISDDELCECGGGSKLIAHACKKRG